MADHPRRAYLRGAARLGARPFIPGERRGARGFLLLRDRMRQLRRRAAEGVERDGEGGEAAKCSRTDHECEGRRREAATRIRVRVWLCDAHESTSGCAKRMKEGVREF